MKYSDAQTAEINLHRMIRELEERSAEEETELDNVYDELKDLRAKLDQVWNAPGMPGYIEARNSFSEELEKQQLIGHKSA